MTDHPETTRTVPVAHELMIMRKYGGMKLIYGFPVSSIGRMTRLQRKRVIAIASGQALRKKAEGKHNAAHSWFTIASEVFSISREFDHG